MINGVNSEDFLSGWWGNDCEGSGLLNKMGVSTETLPFSMDKYLSSHTEEFNDCDGNVARICFKARNPYFEFVGIYKGKKRVTRLYREWDDDDIDMIIHLESQAIGECTRVVLG